MVLFGTFTDPLTTESGKTTIKSSQDGSLNSQTDKVSNKSEDLSSGRVCAGCQQDCPSHSSPSLCSFLCFTRRVLQDDSCTAPAGTFLYTRYLNTLTTFTFLVLLLSALVVFFAVGLLLYLGLLCRRQTRRARPEVYNYEKIYQIDSEDSDSDAELYLGGYR